MHLTGRDEEQTCPYPIIHFAVLAVTGRLHDRPFCTRIREFPSDPARMNEKEEMKPPLRYTRGFFYASTFWNQG